MFAIKRSENAVWFVLNVVLSRFRGQCVRCKGVRKGVLSVLSAVLSRLDF